MICCGKLYILKTPITLEYNTMQCSETQFRSPVALQQSPTDVGGAVLPRQLRQTGHVFCLVGFKKNSLHKDGSYIIKEEYRVQSCGGGVAGEY